VTDATGGVNVLKTLMAILRDSDRPDTSQLHVIPCLTDDLASCIDAITAVVRQAGGAVLNTSTFRSVAELPAEAENFQAAVRGTPPTGWAAKVTAALRITRVSGRYQVRLETANNMVDARYEAFTATDPDPGPADADDQVLAVARALCSERLLAHQLGVLIYDETVLDASQKAPLWGLSQQLRGPALKKLHTLVILARASVQIPRHTQQHTGFRWALAEGKLLRRYGWSSAQANINDILGSGAPFIVLFLGAGFSASSGLALGNDLRNQAIERMGLTVAGASSDQLAAAFYEWVADNGRLLPSEETANPGELASSLTLERVLREEYLSFAGEDPPTLREFKAQCDIALTRMGGAPVSLAHLIASGRKVVMCTVNFDELIEHAAGPDRVRAFSSDHDFGQSLEHLQDYLRDRSNQAPLWKLHGSIGDLRTCIANDAVTLMGLSKPKEEALHALLTQSDKPIPWIYVGASMRDTDLNPVLGRREFAEELREYWVLPHSVPSVEEFAHAYRAERWKNQRRYDERLVTETADTFLTALADHNDDLVTR
jgi:hypothetical protein